MQATRQISYLKVNVGKSTMYNTKIWLSKIGINIILILLVVLPGTTYSQSKALTLPSDHLPMPAVGSDILDPGFTNFDNNPKLFIVTRALESPLWGRRRVAFSVNFDPYEHLGANTPASPLVFSNGPGEHEFALKLKFDGYEPGSGWTFYNAINLYSSNCTVVDRNVRLATGNNRTITSLKRVKISQLGKSCDFTLEMSAEQSNHAASMGDVSVGVNSYVGGVRSQIPRLKSDWSPNGRLPYRIELDHVFTGRIESHEVGGTMAFEVPTKLSYRLNVPKPSIGSTATTISLYPIHKNGVHDGHLRMAGRAPLTLVSYYPFTLRAHCSLERHGQCIIASDNDSRVGLILAANVEYQGKKKAVCMSTASGCLDPIYDPTGIRALTGMLHLTTRFDARYATLPPGGTKLFTTITLTIESQM